MGHGLGLWFDADLAPGVGFSNAPGQPRLIYGQAFFPWPEPVALAPGDTVDVRLQADLVGEDYVWTWESLVRALVALVDNAIKFSPAGTSVEIRTELDGERILVAVEDHGIGIPHESQPRIFDRFYHLDRSGDELFNGIGVGLAITRQVIEQHQGSLNVVSEPGEEVRLQFR